MISPECSELDFIPDPEWAEARRLLEAGFTLGIVAHNEEPVTFLAAIANRLKGLPLQAYCDDDENMLYVAAKDAVIRRLEVLDPKLAAKARKRLKRRSA